MIVFGWGRMVGGVGTHASFAVCGGFDILMGFTNQHGEVWTKRSGWVVMSIGNCNYQGERIGRLLTRVSGVKA